MRRGERLAHRLVTQASVVTAAVRATSAPPRGRAEHDTVVLRLPRAARERVADLVAELRAALDDEVVWARPDRTHVTVRNLDARPGRLDAADAARVRDAVAAMGPPRLRLSGIGLTPTGVHLRALDVDGDLARLREAVTATLGLAQAPPVRRLAVVTLGRLDARLGPGAAWTLHRARATDLGEVRPACLQVVRTDRWLSAEATVVHGAVRLQERE